MDAITHAEVVRIAQIVQGRVSNLTQTLNEYLYRDYPNPNIRELIAGLVKACDWIASEAVSGRESADEFRNEPSNLGPVFNYMGQLNQLLRYLHSTIKFLQEADVYALPNDLAEFIERSMMDVSQSCCAYVHGYMEYNYYHASIGAFLEEVFGSLGVDTGVSVSFGIIGFPRGERDNVLAGVLIAHEAGHHLYNASQLYQEASRAAVADGCFAECEEYVRMHVVGKEGQLKLGDEDKREEREVWDSVRKWIAELCADRIAVYLAGPAFLVAFGDYILAQGGRWGAFAESHPAPADRVDRLYSWLMEPKGPWRESIQKWVEPVLPWLPRALESSGMWTVIPVAGGMTAIEKERVVVVREVVRRLVEYAFAVVDKRFEPDHLHRQSRDFAHAVEPVFALLNQGFPAGEARDGEGGLARVAETTVLLAGWIMSLTDVERKLGDGTTPRKSAESHGAAMLRLNEIVGKSLEVSLLKDLWPRAAEAK